MRIDAARGPIAPLFARSALWQQAGEAIALSLHSTAIVSRLRSQKPRRWARAASAAVVLFGIGSALAATVDWPSSYLGMTQGSQAVGDSATDEANDKRDVIGSSTLPATSVWRDAEHLFFQIRVDGDPSGPGGFSFSWACAVDTDGDFSQVEFVAGIDGGAETVEWSRNTNQAVANDPSDYAERVLWTAAASTHARIIPAGSNFPTGAPNADYFVEFAIDLGSASVPGIVNPDCGDATNGCNPAVTPADVLDPNAPIRAYCGSSSNAQLIDRDLSGSGTTIEAHVSDRFRCDDSGCVVCTTLECDGGGSGGAGGAGGENAGGSAGETSAGGSAGSPAQGEGGAAGALAGNAGESAVGEGGTPSSAGSAGSGAAGGGAQGGNQGFGGTVSLTPQGQSIEGGGCACTTAPRRHGALGGIAAALAALSLLRRRRQRT